MKRNLNTRENLIQEGLHAILALGYDGAGIDQILRARGVPKGSFYHFFRSKEDFACSVLAAYSAHYSAIRTKVFGDIRQPPSARLRRYFKLLQQELSRSIVAGGCLLGVLAHTAGNRGPDLVRQLAASFQEWEDSLRLVIVEGQNTGDIVSNHEARLIAALLIDAYEGAIVRVKASGKMVAFKRFMSNVLEPLLVSGTAR